jgi:HD-GYP domain-containing protein (c-di-GMP phosphodiesterase class II)
VSRYPGFSLALGEVVTVLARQVESEETWPLVDWIAREMHAASPDEIVELIDRASAEIVASAPAHRRRRVLSHLDAARASVTHAVALETSGRGDPEMAVDAMHAMLRVAAPSLAGHLVSVGALAARLACRLGLDAGSVRDVRTAGRLIDVGLTALPPALLQSPSLFDAAARATAQSHCVLGERILNGIDALRPFAALVRMHHERLDGSGYPDGLRANEIPHEVRVLSVADVFVAMTSPRPYRGAHGVAQTIDHLRANSGKKYDPAVVAALAQLVSASGGVGADHHAAA